MLKCEVEEVPVENFVKKKVTSSNLNTGPGSKSSSLRPKSGNKEKEFNCMECFFQGTSVIELNRTLI